MAIFQGNPALRTSVFSRFRDELGEQVAAERQLATVEGAINKTGLLVVLAIAAAIYPWTLAMGGALGTAYGIAKMAGLVGIGLALFTMFMSPKSVRWVAPVFAVVYGLSLGGISAVLEARYPGIPMMAFVATFGVLGTMLVVYRTGLVKVTDRFKMIVSSLVGALMLIALVSWFTSMFFGFSLLHHGGTLGIVVSGGIVVLFSMYLLVQFQQVKEMVAMRSPKWVEWHAAFGIMLALVWIYMEILNILAIFSGRE
jgi:uncharacterized YccA/Bax inhibitor family protein